MGRVDVVMSLLELDAAQLPTWLSSDWTPEQAAAIAKRFLAVRTAKTGSDAVHTVTSRHVDLPPTFCVSRVLACYASVWALVWV